ncbi:MAG: SRPBCC family protein [Chloroflexi bacterium]|nr:SRPBCC family protein [Chloroflexota bacterium]
MARIEREVVVAAPPERVFAMLVEPEMAARHLPSVVAVRNRTPGPIGVGSRWVQVMRLAGRQVDAQVQVVAFEPPAVCAIDMTAPPGPRFHIALRVTPQGAGTLVRQTFEYEVPGGLLGALASRLVIERLLNEEIAQNLAILKRVAEAEFGGAAG